jgi:hypothetical protein
MTDRYYVTNDAGVQIARTTGLLSTVAEQIRADILGRRHVRCTTGPRLHVTVDIQRHTFVVFLHGARLDPHDWPSWVTQLSTLLGFPMQETTRHDHDHRNDG